VITGCEGVGDFPRAAQWCGAMVATSERWQGRYMSGMCRSAYGSILATQGDWPAGDAALAAAVDAMQATRPPMAGGGLARLGELRARQGRTEEASDLFRQAGAHPLGLVGLGGLALDRGDAEAAADAAERVLRRLADGMVLDRFPALELLARARAAQGMVDAAGVACDELTEIAGRLSTPYLKGRARLAGAGVAQVRGDHEQARRLCEDAIDLFSESAAPYEEARARSVLADTLAALGRDDAAAQERRAADDTLARLGASERRGVAPGGVPGEPGELTSRELEVLRLVASGKSDAAVAEELVVSPHTVHRHVANIRMKLGMPSRAAAVAYAARENLL
jgi:ATP/maltotriose-dependent transcriptional regulator MalT